MLPPGARGDGGPERRSTSTDGTAVAVVGEHLAMGFGARVGRTGFMGRHWPITHAVLDLDTLAVEEVEVLREELVRRFVRPP